MRYSDGLTRCFSEASNDHRLMEAALVADSIARLYAARNDEELFQLRLMNDWYRMQIDNAPKARKAAAA